MKDWKAAVRTWENRDRQNDTSSRRRDVKHAYPQHKLTDEQLAHLYVDLDNPTFDTGKGSG